MKIKLSDYIAKRLKEYYGVKNMFMISGGGAMHLNDSFGKYILYVCNHNEQASAMAAEGYARVNQDLAVVNVTTGPGGLNCLNGVFGAWTDSAPILFISGQVKLQTCMASCPDIPLRQLGDQEVDIISTVKHLTKYAVMITEPNSVKYHLDKAIYEATHNRFGPVWLDIPINIQAAMIDEDNLAEFTPPSSVSYDLQLNSVLSLLKSAKRPLIVAGHGIRLTNAQNDFLTLTEKLQIPVVTTMNGFDIISDDNPLFMARIGTVANRAGNFILQNADLILSIGSRNNIRQISYNWENFAKKAKLICIDIDKAELDKPTIRPVLKINCDAKAFITAMSQQEKIQTDNKLWLDWCTKIKGEYPPLTEVQRQPNNPLEPYFFIHALVSQFKENDLIVAGNGTAFLLPFQVGKVKKGQRYIWNSGDASMGYGLPAAIGACVATGGKRRTICLEGDGSIMMNIQELQTVKTLNLPLKIFIINNNGYISIRQTQNNFFDGRLTACSTSSGVELPDFIKVAQAFGLNAVRIESPDNLPEQINKVLDSDGPIVCEVMVNPDYIFSPKLSAKKLADGTMISPSLEDMYPFLPLDELKENMLDD